MFLWETLGKFASLEEDNNQKLLRDKRIFFVGEAEVIKQKYINTLVGGLDVPSETFLIEY